MGWKRDPEKFRRHVQEARTFWQIAQGDEPAGLEDVLGRPFLPPDGPPQQYPDAVLPRPTGPGDTDSDMLFRLQQLAQLYEAGLLTPAEFETVKARILAGG